MKVTLGWVRRMSKQYPTTPEWNVAMQAWNEMNAANKHVLSFYDFQYAAVHAVVDAMLTVQDQINNVELDQQRDMDLCNNMRDRTNYVLEFRYDVATTYLYHVEYLAPDGRRLY